MFISHHAKLLLRDITCDSTIAVQGHIAWL